MGKIKKIWSEAIKTKREAVIVRIPEDIYEAIEQDPELRWEAVSFLGTECGGRYGEEALRALGCLCEDFPDLLPSVTPLLRTGVESADLTHQWGAVTAIHQAYVVELLPELEKLLNTLEEGYYRKEVEHVFNIVTYYKAKLDANG